MESYNLNVNVVTKVSLYAIGIGLSIYFYENSKMSSEKETHKLFEDFMQWRLNDTPEFATCIGITDFDDKLEHYSAVSFVQRKEACEDFLKRAELLEIDTIGEMLRNINLLKYELTTELEGIKYYSYSAPLNYFEGPQSEILQLVSYMKKDTVEDFRKIIKRYETFPRQVHEMIDMMKIGIEQKTTNHASSMTGVIEQLRNLQGRVETSNFYKPFLTIPDTIPEDEKLKLRSQAKEAISSQLLPAFKTLESFIENSYLPSTRKNIAATSLPDGENYYKTCLKFHLSCDLTPQEVHDLGLKEVDRISKEMEKIIKDLNLNLTIQEFSEKIRNDPQFFYTDKEQMLQGYRNIVSNDILPLLKNIFADIPKAELIITPLPETQAAGPLAYYLAGSFDGKRPGSFFVNVANLKNSPKYEMMSLALHEGLPGHHLQNSFMIELPNVPKFRQIVEDRKYFSHPARFPMHTAYIEGWGLYSEYLGNELGLYKDPYSLFGRLSQEIFRACRLVVDTGMHAFGWSMEKSVDYMLQHSAAAKENIQKEINRYVMWPGQALAYKVGELKIKALRRKVEEKLGDAFNLKEFHNLVLNCVGPLSYLEEQVDQYISDKL